MSKTLYLLPNLLDENQPVEGFLPSSLKPVVNSLTGLFAESEKGARKYLLKFMDREKMQKVQIKLLNEHTEDKDLQEYIHSIREKEIWGVVSDAGLPIIADPGAKLTMLAHRSKMHVKMVSGPSSIMMALVMSGFNGQKFQFHGYLPRKEEQLVQALKDIEKKAKQEQSTQIWIEAPYRTQKMIDLSLQHLQKNTLFCVAINLTSSHEKVLSMSIAEWKKLNFKTDKSPAVFLLA
ncbi:MAG: hypothetical protein COT84_07205 [Chlamydiae bacterium CG10_big_fil_rev_8_21_14_0_10_35_9]|nr:MAG: hypothetical protein COT84_07205 [Chlamydiae bacterium CG10_big_fil_rev_8_21_14_0_10_35_9]